MAEFPILAIPITECVQFGLLPVKADRLRTSAAKLWTPLAGVSEPGPVPEARPGHPQGMVRERDLRHYADSAALIMVGALMWPFGDRDPSGRF